MAGKRQRPNGSWEYVFKKAGVLEKPIYMTFHSEEEGDAYAERLEKLLDQGIVPMEHQPKGRVMTVSMMCSEYLRDAHPSDKDRACLNVIVRRHGRLPLIAISAQWVDDWITSMKREERLAPASIRARVGALARATDWAMRKGYVEFPDHPLRSLPHGYAQYTDTDIALAGVRRVDQERDRRLEPGEYERITEVIRSGEIKRRYRTYKIPHKEAVEVFFNLALETAMRMREMYTLTAQQVNLQQRTVFLDKTKNGDKRQVPLSSVAMAMLTDYFANQQYQPNDLVFPFWDGKEETLVKTSDWVSSLYKRIFIAAGCEGLTFHDLRHEATSRLYERTNLSDTKIMKITGHRNIRMLMRYTNLRASSLADELW